MNLAIAKRIVSDKILKERASEVAVNLKYDGYQGEIVSMFYNFFWFKTTLDMNVNEVLPKELLEPVTKTMEKKYARFKDNMSCHGIIKYIWVKPLT